MEFFLELALTISLPLLISFFIAKLLSKDTADEELISFGLDFQFGSRIHDLKSDSARVAAEGFVNDDEIGCRLKQGDVTAVDESGSKCDCELPVIEPVELVGRGTDEGSINDGGGCGRKSGDNVIDKSSFRDKDEEARMNQDKKDISESDGDEVIGIDRSKGCDEIDDRRSAEEKTGEDDDWEGIEKTELERLFDAAVECVRINASNNSNFGSELKMQLCGLQKIATEGPCRVPPPMALKISARSKWNAWKQLGNMTPEEAMECYINLVSENNSGWTVSNEQSASHTHERGKLASEIKPL